MAFNLHFGNTWKEVDIRQYTSSSTADTCFDYRQKIGNLNPSLSIQYDVLFPNAFASVNSQVDGSLHNQVAVGCRGNRLDNEFPLEPRVQTCLPLIQYPTSTKGTSLEEMDMCAKPVLNWENHIKELKRVLRVPLGYTNPALNSRLGCFKVGTQRRKKEKPKEPTNENAAVTLRKQVLIRAAEKADAEGHTSSSEAPLTREMVPKKQSQKKGEHSDEGGSETSEPEEIVPEEQISEHTDSNEVQSTESVETFERETDTEPEKGAKTVRRKRIAIKRLSMAKKARALRGKTRDDSTKLFKKYLYEEEADLEETKAQRIKRMKELRQKGLIPKKKSKPRLRPVRVFARDRLPLFCIKKYKTLPPLRIQGTWNCLYAGVSGACLTIESIYDTRNRLVFTGCGTQLRVVTLKLSDRNSMLSYKVDSVWEEEKKKVPTNIRPGEEAPLSDLVYEIVPDQRNGIIAVRRGKSVEIYDVSERPNLLFSTPNICSGRKDYVGWKLKRFVKDPLLLSVDLNPIYAGEMITIDENLVVNISWFSGERKALSSFLVPREHLNPKPPFREYPNFRINEWAAGVSYASANSILMWADSCVYHSDRRSLIGNTFANTTDRTKLFDLQKSTSSMSWSDQMYFQYGYQFKFLNEFISCVKPSANPYYYYIGTTSRVFMMDWRVPNNPVMKMTHGMRSAATYIDNYHDGNYEVVVLGAQRTHETFCLVTDHAHASCIDRPECKARNPIMLSCPRHLSNSRDFHHETQVQHMIHSWPSDLKRTKDHNYAWTTGLAVCKSPRGNNPDRPPGIAVFTSNHYGDIFYQEWDQAPLEIDRQTIRGDPRLTSFLSEWRDAMELPPEHYDDLIVESYNPKLPVDVSVYLKTAANAIPQMAQVRSKKFDIFKPNSVYDSLVKKNLQPLVTQVARMKRLVKSEIRSTRILNVWEDDWEEDDLCIELGKRAEEVVGITTDFPDLPNPVPNPNIETESQPTPESPINVNQEPENESVLSDQQQEILTAMKEEMDMEGQVYENYDSDPDVIFCDDEDDDDAILNEQVVELDGVPRKNEIKENEIYEENAQRFSTQELDEVGFPGLGDFYPVYSNPAQILPDDSHDLYNQPDSSFLPNKYGTMDQDDHMNFGGSQQSTVYSQELFSSQPNSQQFLFQSYSDQMETADTTEVSPFPYNPLDTGPSTSRASLPRSQQKSSQSQSYTKKPGF